MGLFLSGFYLNKYAPDYFWFGMIFLALSMIMASISMFRLFTGDYDDVYVTGIGYRSKTPLPLYHKIGIGYWMVMVLILGPAL